MLIIVALFNELLTLTLCQVTLLIFLLRIPFGLVFTARKSARSDVYNPFLLSADF